MRFQGDTLITILDISMLPKIALATVSHVHRFKQILLLTCKLFLPELLPSGSTMINRRWANNWEPHINIVDNRITLYNLIVIFKLLHSLFIHGFHSTLFSTRTKFVFILIDSFHVLHTFQTD